MFTIATLPKPFIGHIGIIQRNAIASWLQMKPRPELLFFGAEEGVADAAAEFGAKFVPRLQGNVYGMPYLSSAIRAAESGASSEFLCFVNCDIILFPELVGAFERIRRELDRFLLVGECMNLDVRSPIDFSDSAWAEHWQREAMVTGKRRGANADYFIFRRGMYRDVPPLIHGRAFYDNWILYETRRLRLPVVDVTPVMRTIHQNHFYAHVPGETLASHKGEEAHENLRLMGGYDHVYWITDSTHRLFPGGLRRNVCGTLLLTQRWLRVKRFLVRLKRRILSSFPTNNT
jgi:hypothetical protein